MEGGGWQTGCQTGLITGLTTVLNEQHCSFNRLSNRVVQPADNGFGNRLYRVYKHLRGCQSGLTTGLTTGCIV